MAVEPTLPKLVTATRASSVHLTASEIAPAGAMLTISSCVSSTTARRPYWVELPLNVAIRPVPQRFSMSPALSVSWSMLSVAAPVKDV